MSEADQNIDVAPQRIMDIKGEVEVSRARKNLQALMAQTIPAFDLEGHFDWHELYNSQVVTNEDEGTKEEKPHSRLSSHTHKAYESLAATEKYLAETQKHVVPPHLKHYLDKDAPKPSCCRSLCIRTGKKSDAESWAMLDLKHKIGNLDGFTTSEVDRNQYHWQSGNNLHCPLCPYGGELHHNAFKRFRLRLHWILEQQDYNNLSKGISIFMTLTILLSIFVFVLETEEKIYEENSGAFFIVECILIGIFSLEYLLRSMVNSNLCKWLISPWNIIDILSIMPFYVEFILNVVDIDNGYSILRIFRAMRLFRILRLLEVGAFQLIERIITRTVSRSLPALAAFVVGVMLIVIVMGSLFYSFEKNVVDKATGISSRCHLTGENVTTCSYPDLESVPNSLWWGIQTVTAEGYGDFFPLTTVSKIIAMLGALLGLLVLSLPISITATFFLEAYYKVTAETLTIEMILEDLRKYEKDLRVRTRKLEKLIGRETLLVEKLDDKKAWEITLIHHLLTINNNTVIDQLHSLIRFIETSRMCKEDHTRIMVIDPTYFKEPTPWGDSNLLKEEAKKEGNEGGSEEHVTTRKDNESIGDTPTNAASPTRGDAGANTQEVASAVIITNAGDNGGEGS